jgi:hypothetical protein
LSRSPAPTTTSFRSKLCKPLLPIMNCPNKRSSAQRNRKRSWPSRDVASVGFDQAATPAIEGRCTVLLMDARQERTDMRRHRICKTHLHAAPAILCRADPEIRMSALACRARRRQSTPGLDSSRRDWSWRSGGPTRTPVGEFVRDAGIKRPIVRNGPRVSRRFSREPAACR